MINRRIGLVSLILSCFFATAGLLQAATKIGVILPETGAHAGIAILERFAFETALDVSAPEDGSQLELVFADNYNNPDSARVAAERLAESPDVIALAGGYPSACCDAITRVAELHRIPYLIISASADTLTRRAGRYVFRLAPPTSDYNDGLIGWAVTVAGVHSNIVVLYDDRPQWMDAVNDIKRDLAGKWSGKVDYLSFVAGENDFSRQLTEIRHLKSGIVWLFGNTGDIARFMRRCRDAGFAPAAFVVGTVKQVNRKIISAAQGAADYSYGPAVWWFTHPYAGVEQFVRMYQERTTEPPDYHAAEAFAAIQVIQDALNRVDTVSREDFRASLLQTDMVTALGRVKFETYRGFTNQNRVNTCAVQLRGDRWVTVWPLQFAADGYIYPMPEWSDRGEKSDSRIPSSLVLVLIVVLIWAMLSAASRKRREIKKQLDR